MKASLSFDCIVCIFVLHEYGNRCARLNLVSWSIGTFLSCDLSSWQNSVFKTPHNILSQQYTYLRIYLSTKIQIKFIFFRPSYRCYPHYTNHHHHHHCHRCYPHYTNHHCYLNIFASNSTSHISYSTQPFFQSV